ncbi:MAG: hypothetical protein WCX27_02975, partial [Candidatus Paceibacterota bacterium]
MIRDYLKQSSIYNVLSIESLISEEFRNKLSRISKYIVYILVIVLLVSYFAGDNPNFAGYKSIIDSLAPRITGLIFVNVGILLFSKLANFYLNSTYYFEKISKNKYEKDELYTFSAGRVLYAGRKTDILHGFLNSALGRRILARLGVDRWTIKKFSDSAPMTKGENIPKSEENILKLKDIITYLYAQRQNFAKFLNEKGITDKELMGATNWVIYEIERQEYNNQWWRPETLAKIKGIASDWAFGRTYVLDQYGRDLGNDEEVNSEAVVISDRESEIGQIENALSKTMGANAMIVGEPGQDKMQVIWSMTRNIKNGTIASALAKKKVILLSVSALASVCKTKDTFENQISRIFKEVTYAGNIILVIDNFGQLVTLAENLGSDFTNLIDSFLGSASVQVVALVNTSDFHQSIEPNAALMTKFEKIMVRPLSTEEITRIISAS